MTTDSSIRLDRLDWALLRALSADGRASHVELGERIGLSPTAVARRQRALEEAGVICGYGARLDAAALGRGHMVVVRLTLKEQAQESLDAFEAAVAREPAIQACYLLAGQEDYLMILPIGSLDGFEALHRNVLAKLPHVARIETSFAIRTVTERASVLDALGRADPLTGEPKP